MSEDKQPQVILNAMLQYKYILRPISVCKNESVKQFMEQLSLGCFSVNAGVSDDDVSSLLIQRSYAV